MANTDMNVVIKGDLFVDHFDLSNTDGSNKIKVKFPEQTPLPDKIVTEMVIDPVQKKLKWKENGTPKEYDISSFTVDLSVDGHTFDARTGMLTLTKTGGTPVNIDLAKLSEVAISNDAAKAVKLSGTGSNRDPLKADVKVKAGDDNLLAKTNGELEVPRTQVKAAAKEAATEKLGELNTVTFKNTFGTETIGKFYVAP